MSVYTAVEGTDIRLPPLEVIKKPTVVDVVTLGGGREVALEAADEVDELYSQAKKRAFSTSVSLCGQRAKPGGPG